MAITLKNITARNLKTIAWPDMNTDGRTAYSVYDGTPNSGKCLQNKFLGIIYYDSKKQDVVFNNVIYNNAIMLEKALFDWALDLPWCSDYYDPTFRVGIKETYIIRDYLKSLGFEYVNGDRFTLSGINHFFNTVYIDVIVKVEDDATSGTIMFNSPKTGDYAWVEETFVDLDDALGKLNMLIGSQLLVSAAWALDIQSKLTNNTANIEGTSNKFNVKSMSVYTENTKDKLIAKLEDTLNTLKLL